MSIIQYRKQNGSQEAVVFLDINRKPTQDEIADNTPPGMTCDNTFVILEEAFGNSFSGLPFETALHRKF